MLWTSVARLHKDEALPLVLFLQFCKLRRSVSASVSFAEAAEVLWLDPKCLGFMRRLVKTHEDSLHADILKDNIQDAKHSLLVAIWAAGVQKQFANLRMASQVFGWCRRDG